MITGLRTESLHVCPVKRGSPRGIAVYGWPGQPPGHDEPWLTLHALCRANFVDTSWLPSQGTIKPVMAGQLSRPSMIPGLQTESLHVCPVNRGSPHGNAVYGWPGQPPGHDESWLASARSSSRELRRHVLAPVARHNQAVMAGQLSRPSMITGLQSESLHVCPVNRGSPHGNAVYGWPGQPPGHDEPWLPLHALRRGNFVDTSWLPSQGTIKPVMAWQLSRPPMITGLRSPSLLLWEPCLWVAGTAARP